MTDAMIGEIMMTGTSFSPAGYYTCSGQLLPISQFSVLFAIIGNYYGGDGRTTMALPNLNGRAPLHVGGTSNQGPGLSLYQLTEETGESSVVLNYLELPEHTHGLVKVAGFSDDSVPSSSVYPGFIQNTSYYSSTTNNSQMNASAVSTAGGNLSHENRQPFNVVRYCINWDGIFPSRN